jgi:hypothetical protein
MAGDWNREIRATAESRRRFNPPSPNRVYCMYRSRHGAARDPLHRKAASAVPARRSRVVKLSKSKPGETAAGSGATRSHNFFRGRNRRAPGRPILRPGDNCTGSVLRTGSVLTRRQGREAIGHEAGRAAQFRAHLMN